MKKDGEKKILIKKRKREKKFQGKKK